MALKTAGAVIAILACGTMSAAAADLPTIRIAEGAFGTGLASLPYAIATKQGFFAREGVRAEKVAATDSNPRAFAKGYIPGTEAAFEQGYIPGIERDGTANIESVPNGQFVQVVLNGSDAVAIAAENANPAYSLMVRPEIKTWTDLKGKEITFTAPWDNITLSARKLLEMHGVGPNDYHIKDIPGTVARMACLKGGECAAVVIGQPADIDALKMGYRRLGYTNEVGPLVFNVMVVSRSWAEKNRDTLVRYLRADAAAMRFIHDPKNHDEVAKTLTELTKEPKDVVDEMMANIANPKMDSLTREGEVNVAGFRHVLELIKEFGLTTKPLPPVEHLIDLSYAKAAGIH